MKIAQVAPLMESVPPKLYGGTERIVFYLTEELIRQGHEVTLFASGDSRTSATLVAGSRMALRLSEDRQDPLLQHLLMLEKLRDRYEDFDVIHFHMDLLQFPFLRSLNCPSVTTLHGRLDGPGISPFYREFNEAQLVTISRSQRRSLPDEAQASLVYHGLPQDLLHYGKGQGGYLAFLGRISPEKGPADAIAIALAAGLPLKIAAKIDKVDADFWRDVVKPLVDKNASIEFVGEISEREKGEFLGNASALLFPIDWPEPFGLVMIEAMACGTPIIAYPMGSVPEIVEEGRSGYIVGSREAAVAAVERLDEIDRRVVRQCFDHRFTATRMSADYLKLYAKLTRPKGVNGHVYGPPLAVADRRPDLRSELAL
ncbi:glycosyltransferase family 4 protein [Nordella sp. HKS 07]|uniref:glycosyltransferase family 4 protein n=1 Tax=Nordella sp. HKS 07 TaxID=2712222 RepID=UPI0013E13A1F|nr:glycosyltransferase family 4 protein [Nordella sp. HKS 07]QIG51064.1 glycosyltransferase family 4 protein [Nordella sp. HKS 07]